MFRQLLLFSFFLSYTVPLSAQSPPPSSYFDSLLVPDSINFFLLGENHQMNNTPHKLELIKHLYKTWGVKEIGLEYPRTLEKRVNDYIIDGNLVAFDEIKDVFFQNKWDQHALLEGIYILNKGLSQSNKLHVTCFDMDMDPRDIALIELEAMLDYHSDMRLDTLISIIQISNNELLLDNAIKELREELINNFQLYYEILGDDLIVLNDAINAAEITAKHEDISLDNDTLYLERENFICHSLNEAIMRMNTKKMLVFIGSYHISNLEIDDISETSSSNFILRNQYARNTLSVVTIYHNQKHLPMNLFSSSYADYLNLDLFHFFKKRKKQFFYLGKESFLASPDIFARFDGILVKDCMLHWR